MNQIDEQKWSSSVYVMDPDEAIKFLKIHETLIVDENHMILPVLTQNLQTKSI